MDPALLLPSFVDFFFTNTSRISLGLVDTDWITFMHVICVCINLRRGHHKRIGRLESFVVHLAICCGGGTLTAVILGNAPPALASEAMFLQILLSFLVVSYIPLHVFEEYVCSRPVLAVVNGIDGIAFARAIVFSVDGAAKLYPRDIHSWVILGVVGSFGGGFLTWLDKSWRGIPTGFVGKWGLNMSFYGTSTYVLLTNARLQGMLKIRGAPIPVDVFKASLAAYLAFHNFSAIYGARVARKGKIMKGRLKMSSKKDK